MKKKNSYFTFKYKFVCIELLGKVKALKKIVYQFLILLLLWQPCYFDPIWSKYLKRDILKLTVSILFKFGHTN